MKKKTKIIIWSIVAVLLIAILLVVGFLTYLAIAWRHNGELGHDLVTEGPWSSEKKWVSEDGSSYLVAEFAQEDDTMAGVTAYFKVGDNWNAFDANFVSNILYLESLSSDALYTGNMKFDGTTFTIKNLETNDDNANGIEIRKYNYTVTDEVFTGRE